MFVADRSHLIDASGIRSVFDLAASLEDPVDLSIGQPFHEVAEAVKESAVRAIRAGKNETLGTLELLEDKLPRSSRNFLTGSRSKCKLRSFLWIFVGPFIILALG